MRSTRALEFKVGLFLNLGIALLIVALVILGTQTSLLTPKASYQVTLPNAGGLLKGAKVMLAGVRVGTVDDFDLKVKPGSVVLRFSIPRKYAELVRSDSTAEVVTEGVVGDRVIELTPGSPGLAQLQPGAEISYRPRMQLYHVVDQAGQLITRLNGVARNLDRLVSNPNFDATLERLNRILTKIDRGSGTLSALLNDLALYDDAKALMGQANENRVLRNLVRKTLKDAEKQRQPAGRK